MRRKKIHDLSREHLKTFREDLRNQISMLNNYEDITTEFPYLSNTEDEDDYPFRESLPLLPSLGNVVKTFNPKTIKVLKDPSLRDFISTLPSFLLIPVTKIEGPNFDSFASADQVVFHDIEFLWVRLVEIDNVVDTILLKSEKDYELLKLFKTTN